MLQLILYWPRPRDLPRPSPCICCLLPKTKTNKQVKGWNEWVYQIVGFDFIYKTGIALPALRAVAQFSISFHKISA